MPLLALGINHKTASVAMRERVAFNSELLLEANRQLRGLTHVQAGVIVSTCNRTELYCDMTAEAAGEVLDWLSCYHQLDLDELQRCTYLYWDQEAVRHLMRVAGGLDSMVLGEPQILGQIKAAFSSAVEAGGVGSRLNRLFQSTFSVAKQVRTDTAIGRNPVSVAYAAVNLAQHIFSDLKKARALLIGAGETIELVARHLYGSGVHQMTVANRTLTRANDIAHQYGAKPILLADIPEHLVDADIVITSTASQLPILGKGVVERAIKKRKHQPIFMVDIAVPRDVEPEVGELDDVYLYTVDDLQEVIEENTRSREVAAGEAEAIVTEGSEQFMQALRVMGAAELVTLFRNQADVLRRQELDKALKALRNGGEPEKVLTQFGNSLTNKLVHTPTVQMRSASADGREDILELVSELYQLDKK